MKRPWLMFLSLSLCATVVFAAPHRQAFAGDGYSLSLRQTTIHARSEFWYEWSMALNHPNGLWVGLYKVGDTKWNQLRYNAITVYDYAGKLEFGESLETVPGAENLVVPGTALEMRMYSQDRSILYATSPPMVIVDDATPVDAAHAYLKGMNATYAITTTHTRVHGLDLLQFGVLVPHGSSWQGAPPDAVVSYFAVGLYRMSDPVGVWPVTTWVGIDPYNQNQSGRIRVPNPLTGVPVGTVLELRLTSQDRRTLYARSCPMVVVADTVSLPTTPLLCTAVQ